LAIVLDHLDVLAPASLVAESRSRCLVHWELFKQTNTIHASQW